MNLDLYIDTARKELVSGPLCSSIVQVPSFNQGNTINMRIRCLNPTANFPNGNPPYSVLSTAGRSLQLAFGTKQGNTSTHYVEQFTWAASVADLADPYFYADVAMNTAGISTLLGSGSSASAWLEINLVEGTPRTILSKQVTIEASVIKNDTLTVPAGLTPLSAEAAAALYLGRTIIGAFTLQNANGKAISIYVDADGAFHTDPIT
jgi:hypothetical protein